MATYTSYLNLEKPTTSETFNLLKMNQNWDKIDAGVSSLNSKLTYNVGDTFNTRSWRAVGRIISSGKGLFCWIDLARPISANSFNITFDGSPNLFGIGTYTASGTISNKVISGNELQFVIDLSSTHTVGQIGIAEFNASMTLT